MTKIKFESSKYNFDIELLKVGQEHCSPRKLPEKSMRYYYSLHYILYGSGSLVVGGKKIKLTKGDLFLVYRGEEIEYSPDPTDPWSYVWVDFNGDNLSEFLSDCGFSEGAPYVRMGNQAGILLNIIQPLIEEYDGSAVLSVISSGNILKLFGKLIQFNSLKQPLTEKISASRRVKAFREILTFVNNNYRTNLSVQRVCEEMYVSEYQLNSLFKEFTGLTFVNYVNRYRISEACEILLHEDISITDAAHRVGIEDIAYFSRLFVKWKGVSPRDYRKECPDDNPFDWLKGKIFDVR